MSSGRESSKISTVEVYLEKNSKYKAREKWNNKAEFLLSTIGYAIGLGNVWRFPYLCYKNGGGAFLIPYFVCMITGGIPMFMMEVALGQFTSQGGISAWNICPLFRGIGFATTIICALANMYYIVILAWTIHYLYHSFLSVLPWTTCNNWWNTERCYVASAVNNVTAHKIENSVDSVVEYWERRVLRISNGIEEVGNIQIELAFALFVVWLFVYLCVWKGIKSSGKVVYFTATFPYLMLTILLIRGVTLDGAADGISFYLKPNFTKLQESQVWIDAGTQIFFSYAVAVGCMIALGSYNLYHNNFVKDCLFVAMTNSCTSLYSGFAVFSVLGYMAKEQGVPISEVAESGPGLVFIAYPKAISQMPWSPLWAVSFFFMIFLMGIDSQFVAVEGFVTAIVDIFPKYLRRKYRREKFIAISCSVSYLVGLTMVTQGGMYVFQMFDYYAASGIVLLCVCFFECFAIAYVYGVNQFYSDIADMVGFRLNPWFKYCWIIFTPVTVVGILIFSFSSSTPLTYNRVYNYPPWILRTGRYLSMIPIALIPLYFVLYFITRPGNTISKKWKNAKMSTLKKSNESPIEMN